MAANFCHFTLQPRIHCDKPSREDNEVTNLVSPNPRIRAKGFLVDHFVRPPVSVTFHFPVNVDLNKIIIDVKVGTQQASEIEILTHSTKRNDQPWLRQPDTNSQILSIPDRGSFTCIGNLHSKDHTKFCFVNEYYSPRPFGRLGVLPEAPAVPDNAAVSNMRGRNIVSTANVSYLMIKIKRTVGASVPCVKSVEIWGQPALSVRADDARGVCELWLDALRHTPAQLSWFSNSPGDNDAKTENQASQRKDEEDLALCINGVDVPNDFLDPLTCEIMTLPLMLPSGHSVDQCTLDKHTRAEEVWGRPASDPFTGKRFSAQSKPTVNTALKARIDQFLLVHNDKLHSVPRTLGHGNTFVTDEKSLTMVPRKLCDTNVQDTHLASVKSRNAFGSTKRKTNPDLDRKESPRNTKRQKRETSVQSNLTMTHKVNDPGTGYCEAQKEKAHHQMRTVSNKAAPSSCSSQPKNHEEKLQNSLDDAFLGALSRLPSFRKSASETVPGNTKTGPTCFMCSEPIQQAHELPCSTKLCRSCLSRSINKSHIHCPACKKEHSSCSIKKIHL